MAVFTPIDVKNVKTFLQDFDLGDFVSFDPIKDGNENTNYFLTTSKGEWVLTLFERLTPEELPFYLELCEHLGARVPEVVLPLRSRTGNLFETLLGKPYSIANRFRGTNVIDMSPVECAAMGKLLAKMHIAGRDFPRHQKNTRSLDWCAAAAGTLYEKMPHEKATLLKNEIEHQLHVREHPLYKKLTLSACHCDLFRNNTLIKNAGTEKATVAGVFDFYFAATAPELFDLAVTMNDWCVNIATGVIKETQAQAFINAYNALRPLSATDKLFWRDMMRAAGLRFWVSRLVDFYKPRSASLINKQDPAQFERIVLNRQTAQLPWPTA